MARTESTMLTLGTVAPDFALTDVVTEKTVCRDDFKDSDALLVLFICAHCPYVKHVEEELARIGKDYEGRIALVAISSNDVVAYPQDAPEEMKKQAERLGFRFPYLYDETQEVARAYDAACTPDFFLFDAGMTLVQEEVVTETGNRIAVETGTPVTWTEEQIKERGEKIVEIVKKTLREQHVNA